MMKLAQNYMKNHVNEWTKAINLELTRIQRLRERQQQVVGLVGVGFVTLGQILAQYVGLKYFAPGSASSEDGAGEGPEPSE